MKFSIERSLRRENKRRKKRNGMQVSNRSIFMLNELERISSEMAKQVHKKKRKEKKKRQEIEL